MRKIYRFIKQAVKPLKLHRFKIFGVLNKKITENIRSNKAVIDGHQMILDDKDSLRLSLNGIYEIEQTNYIKQIVKEGDHVIDIGANIGYYALIMARIVGKSGKVFCFEPDATNFGILLQNINNNKYADRVDLFNAAVSDKSGKLKLFISEKNRGDHRIYESDQSRNFIEIDAVKLDEVESIRDKKIKLIKIDIQGSEQIALQGMKSVISKNKPIVISEFWPHGIKMSGNNPDDYIDFFLSEGYKLNYLTEKGLEEITKERLDKEYSIEKDNFTNIVFIPV